MRKHKTIPQINRLSLIWNNSSSNEGGSIISNESTSIDAYSPLPLPMPRLENYHFDQDTTNNSLPISYQTSLMQMSTSQYYLVVQINVNDEQNANRNLYENYNLNSLENARF